MIDFIFIIRQRIKEAPTINFKALPDLKFETEFFQIE